MMNKILILLMVISLFFVVGCTEEKILYDDMEAPKKIDDMEPPQRIDYMELPKNNEIGLPSTDMETRQPIDDMEPPQRIDEMEPPKTTFYFTFSNERPTNRSIKAVLNGKVIYNGELIFGFGTSEKVNSETTEGVFSFEVTDLTSGIKETTTISTEDGLHVTVSFWEDSITVEQLTGEQVRYD